MADGDDFARDLIALAPFMRAFARMLCNGNVAEADDLAQEACAKAWAARKSYTVGTNLKAWCFMILRNQFYSDKRRSWRSQPLDPEVAERTLIANTNLTGNLEVDEMRRALAMLSEAQREALILIGAGGLSYEEAAEIVGVAVGTMKSRVSRARDAIELIYAEGHIVADGELPAFAMASIMQQVASLTGRPPL
jgi:RNA polymerase sigma-70 factor (ECF subfamily)